MNEILISTLLVAFFFGFCVLFWKVFQHIVEAIEFYHHEPDIDPDEHEQFPGC